MGPSGHSGRVSSGRYGLSSLAGFGRYDQPCRDRLGSFGQSCRNPSWAVRDMSCNLLDGGSPQGSYLPRMKETLRGGMPWGSLTSVICDVCRAAPACNLVQAMFRGRPIWTEPLAITP